MTDDERPQPDPEPTPEPTPVPPLDPQMVALQAQVQALNDVVQSAIVPRTIVNPNTQAPNTVTPQLRAILRQNGMSDADIDHNSPLILPYISAFAPELVGLVESRIGGVDERVTRSEMEQDLESYPYAKPLRSEIKKLVNDAKKENRTLSLEAAYHTAVSLNLDKVRQVDAQRRVESPSTDASALDALGHRSTTQTSTRARRADTPRTVADLQSMSREERTKYWEAVENLPIRDLH